MLIMPAFHFPPVDYQSPRDCPRPGSGNDQRESYGAPAPSWVGVAVSRRARASVHSHIALGAEGSGQ